MSGVTDGNGASSGVGDSSAALQVRDLTIEYSSGGYIVRPIDNFQLESRGGELVLLLGASGCGKTTLLSVLAGILTPSAGSVKVGDTEVVGLSGNALTKYRRNQVGIVFQAFNLLPSLTASENVQIPLRGAGVRPRAAKQRALALLDQVGLSDRVEHRPGDLSGGQQQRVAIARALAHDPPVLLADEPTAHLDYLQVDGVIRLLRSLADSGRLVIVATHDDRLVPLADHIVNLTPRRDTESRPPETRTLDPGEILFRQGDPGELIYTVDSGVIDLVRTREDGTEEQFTSVESGGYFGELAPMFGIQRAATARAATETTVTGYTVRDFRSQHSGSIGELLSGAVDVNEGV
ncbi:MAG TPA: ATP-binding cassette domain-containing protein [Acidimicrobiia bacterium]|nr:ATP-binding cassette domain-containing protein [Acidimicrobiia bacterium]